jgi:hypothetical protein
MSDLQLMTVVTDTEHPGFRRFQLSCKMFNIEPLVFVWKNKFDKGCVAKAMALKENITNLNGTLLYTDSYDAVVVGDLNQMLERYRKLSPKENAIVFSSEKNCYPSKYLKSHYPKHSSPWKYLNAGGFVGPAHLIKSMLSVDLDFWLNDQFEFSKMFLQGSSKIILDYQCELFQALAYSENDVVYGEEKPCNIVTKSYPLILHANGKNSLEKASRWLHGMVSG